MKRFLILMLAILMAFSCCLFACGSDESNNSSEVGLVSTKGVKLNTNTITLTVGESEQLVATVSPANATDKNVTYSSNNEGVATVDSTGKVLAVGEGSAIITVKTKSGGNTATCSVTVNPAPQGDVSVTGVTLNKSSISLTVGSTEILVVNILPANATNKNCTFSTSNSGIATVDESGKVKAIAKGNATITVTTEDGSFTATCIVTVTERGNGELPDVSV